MLCGSYVAADDLRTAHICRDIQQRCVFNRLHIMGDAYLYGRHIFHRRSDLLPADFYGAWTGQNQSADGMPAETGTVNTAYFYTAAYIRRSGLWRVCGGAGKRYHSRFGNRVDAVSESEQNIGARGGRTYEKGTLTIP